MRKLKKYKPTKFKAKGSVYDEESADYAVAFIENLCHTKGTWAGRPFELIDWQEQIIRDIFGTLKPNGYRQFNTAYIEIPKKMGKSELAAAVALLLCCGDGEERAEVYGCAADRQQASIVFEVAADMVRMCPALSKRVKILASQKRIVYLPILIYNFKNKDKKKELLTEEEVEILTLPSELADFKDAITEALRNGTQRNIVSEDSGKNCMVG